MLLTAATLTRATRPPPRGFAACLVQRGQKHYTVFVCAIDRAARDAFIPRLNEEHREWRWFKAEALRSALQGDPSIAPAPLHPVVEALLRQHPDVLR